MPAIRRLSSAEPLWSWGEKRWTAVSVCLAALTRSNVSAYVCRCMHGSICVVRLHVSFFTICSAAFISSPSAVHSLFVSWVYCVFGGFRYPPSSRQTSHEEGKEWLRSHSTGGLQDTGSQSPLSPPGASCTTTGKYHYSNLCKYIGLEHLK